MASGQREKKETLLARGRSYLTIKYKKRNRISPCPSPLGLSFQVNRTFPVSLLIDLFTFVYFLKKKKSDCWPGVRVLHLRLDPLLLPKDSSQSPSARHTQW